jgi:hypothetical protein
VTDEDIDAAIRAFGDWLRLNRNVEFAEWTFTLKDQEATVALAERSRFRAPARGA